MTLSLRPDGAPEPVGPGAFDPQEMVFPPALGLHPAVPVPVFGDRLVWPATCVRRPANIAPSLWNLRFPDQDVGWNLRARELAFALFNPTHPVLRSANVFWPATPNRMNTVRGHVSRIRVLMRYATACGLESELGSWRPADWSGFLTALPDLGARAEQTRTGYRALLRNLYELRDVLTGGGPAEDPGPRPRSGRRTPTVVSTPPVSPGTWWPLLRAAWTYIDTFAADLLAARDAAASATDDVSDPAAPMSPAAVDKVLEGWLSHPGALVPVHTVEYRGASAGTPVWTAISRSLTGGYAANVFHTAMPDRARRRERVLAAVRAGKDYPVRAGQAGRVMNGSIDPSSDAAHLNEHAATQDLLGWLADDAQTIPLTGGSATASGHINWLAMGILVYGRDGAIPALLSTTAGAQRRRNLVWDAAYAGRTHPTPWPGTPENRLDCSHFTQVTRLDGSRGPWRTCLTHEELATELRVVQGACYIFATALTMMRDSEIQELQRGALTEHFGSPAVRSLKSKGEQAPADLRWWIIEPVAQALAVLEQLSWHPSHLFATVRLPRQRHTTHSTGRPGIYADAHIDAFIEHVNTHREATGLALIPPGRVRPHQLRKTMSVICGQQPDGEIALGIQLKHAARRALANRTTRGYAEPDAAWATEFDNELELAAARKLVSLLADRARGRAIAAGPAATRLHEGLDAVLDTVNSPQAEALQALFADERTVVSLLRQEFTDLRLGTLNHCLWQPETAACQDVLPPEQRGQEPLLGACQPARCRNSVVTETHAPIWLAEQADLTRTLGDKRLAPARRAALRERLTEVTRITTQLTQES